MLSRPFSTSFAAINCGHQEKQKRKQSDKKKPKNKQVNKRKMP